MIALCLGLVVLSFVAWAVTKPEPDFAPPRSPTGCPSCRKLAAYVADHLTSGECARLALHLSVCPGCRDHSLALIHRDVRVAPRRDLLRKVGLVGLVLLLEPTFGQDSPRGCAARQLGKVLMGRAETGELPPPAWERRSRRA